MDENYFAQFGLEMDWRGIYFKAIIHLQQL